MSSFTGVEFYWLLWVSLTNFTGFYGQLLLYVGFGLLLSSSTNVNYVGTSRPCAIGIEREMYYRNIGSIPSNSDEYQR